MYAQAIYQNLENNAYKREKKPTIKLATSITIPTELAISIAILFKDNNQGLIALVYNPVFHARIKHINIQH